MKGTGAYLSLFIGAGLAALLYDPFPASGATAPSLGAAGSFTALATNAIPTSGTFTCTTSTINGDVGTTGSIDHGHRLHDQRGDRRARPRPGCH